MQTEEKLISQIIGTKTSKTMVLFGGSPVRRNEIIQLLSEGEDVTIYGTLNEKEGMQKLEELNNKVDLVLVGGRYTNDQRQRISKWVKTHLPQTKLSLPGFDYPYSNDAIRKDVLNKLGH